MKGATPQHNSGKTYFNRIKGAGNSWIKARDEAIKAGKWSRSGTKTPSSMIPATSGENV